MTTPAADQPLAVEAPVGEAHKARPPGLFLRLSETYRDLLDRLAEEVGARGGKGSQANVVGLALDSLDNALKREQGSLPMQRLDGVLVGIQALEAQQPVSQAELYSLWQSMLDALTQQSVIAGERQALAMACQRQLWDLLITHLSPGQEAPTSHALSCLPYDPAHARYAPASTDDLLSDSFKAYQDALKPSPGQQPMLMVATEMEFRPLIHLLNHEFDGWPAKAVMDILRPALPALLDVAKAGRAHKTRKQCPESQDLPLQAIATMEVSAGSVALRFSALGRDSHLYVSLSGGQQLAITHPPTWQAFVALVPWLLHPEAKRYSRAFRRSGVKMSFNESSQYVVRIGPEQELGMHAGLCLSADHINDLQTAVARLTDRLDFQDYQIMQRHMWGAW